MHPEFPGKPQIICFGVGPHQEGAMYKDDEKHLLNQE